MKNNDNTRIWLKISELVRANPTKENKENRALNVQIICPKKMIAHIIAQIVVMIIFLGAIVQIIVFKMQGKKNWWFGIIIAALMIVATIFNWININ